MTLLLLWIPWALTKMINKQHMKKLLFKGLNKVGRLLQWRWLMLTTGVFLISSQQSCNTGKTRCYDAVPVDSTSIEQPTCYKVAIPDDTVQAPVPPDTLK